MTTEIKFENGRIFFRTKGSGEDWAVLYEPGGPCWMCKKKDGIVTADHGELFVFVLSCVKCGATIRLNEDPWDSEAEQ